MLGLGLALLAIGIIMAIAFVPYAGLVAVLGAIIVIWAVFVGEGAIYRRRP